MCTWVSLTGERKYEEARLEIHTTNKQGMCPGATGLLQMQLILHYDMTYREVKYSNLGLEDIDRKMLMGINVTPIIGLLYTPVLIR